jgi:hypothetical protein
MRLLKKRRGVRGDAGRGAIQHWRERPHRTDHQCRSGLSSCAKLGADLKPADGLTCPSALLFFWIQGYLSAANLYLLDDSTNHIDMNKVGAGKMIKLVAISAPPIRTTSRSR